MSEPTTPQIRELLEAAERAREADAQFVVNPAIAHDPAHFGVFVQCVNAQREFTKMLDPTTIAALCRRVERLEHELTFFVVQPEYDCPGDTPEVCGWKCQICSAYGNSRDFKHHEKCVLYHEEPGMTPALCRAELERRGEG